MVHYSCDICGRDIRPALDDLFVVKMSAHLAPKSQGLKESDLAYGEDAYEVPEPEDDGLDSLEDLMMEPIEPAPTFSEFQFELCANCHGKFLADPLSRDAFKFDFSKN